jgi:hypothetical protein
MEKHFVTYNQALALKELGFDEPCFGAYDTHQGDDWILNIQSNYYYRQFSDKNKACLAPLVGQIFKWFRKNHSIHGIVSYYGKGQWNIEILDYKGNELIQIEDNTFWSYEEAESACIDELIEIIKKK